MLASKNFVRSFVKSVADMSADSCNRRQWCDKVKNNSNERLLAFRFFDEDEANAVAVALAAALAAAGYTNKVKRTSVASNAMYRTWGGEYVRVKVVL